MNTKGIDRRRFLKTSGGIAAGTAAAASGAVSLTFSVQAWAAELGEMNPHQAKTILAVARAMFPHPTLADAYYAAVVNDLDAQASEDEAVAETLKTGVAAIDSAGPVAFVDLSDGNKDRVLEGMQDSAFFQAVKGKAITSIYNNPLVWRHFGYEGPSAQHGGYLNRGFNDLSWLDNPPEDASPKPADV